MYHMSLSLSLYIYIYIYIYSINYIVVVYVDAPLLSGAFQGRGPSITCTLVRLDVGVNGVCASGRQS